MLIARKYSEVLLPIVPTICDATLSQRPSGLFGFRFHHVFSDTDVRKHPCSGFNFSANAAVFDVVQTDFCIVLFCPISVVEHRRDYDFTSNDSGFRPFRHV